MSGDVITDFVAAMREREAQPAEEIIADGDLHRVRWRRDKLGTRNGAYVHRLNEHPRRLRRVLQARHPVHLVRKGARLSPAERKALDAKMAEEQAPRAGGARAPRAGGQASAGDPRSLSGRRYRAPLPEAQGRRETRVEGRRHRVLGGPAARSERHDLEHPDDRSDGTSCS